MHDLAPKQVRYERFVERTEIPMLVLSVLLIPVVLMPFIEELSTWPLTVLEWTGATIWLIFAAEYAALLILDRPATDDPIPQAGLGARPTALPQAPTTHQSARPRPSRHSFRPSRLSSRPPPEPPRVRPNHRNCQRARLRRRVPGLHSRTRPAQQHYRKCRRRPLVGIRHLHNRRLRRRVPVTTTGRLVDIILMLAGISGVSVITANIASYFVSTDAEHETDELTQRLERIERQLERLTSDLLEPPEQA